MPGGRPPKFRSLEELEAAIEDYFATADARGWPYTVPDLSLHLGFATRKDPYRYAQTHPEYRDTINRALSRIEAQRNRDLISNNVATQGKIFDLKNNFGWCDSQRLEVGNADGQPFETRQQIVASLLDEIDGTGKAADELG